MHQQFDVARHLQINRDREGVARELLHFEQPFESKARSPQLVAHEYLEAFGDLYGVSRDQLARLSSAPDAEPTDAPAELRLLGEKRFFDTTTVAYHQTVLGLPIWEAGLAVHIRNGGFRVLSSVSTTHAGVRVDKPRRATLKEFGDLGPKALRKILDLDDEREPIAAKSLEVQTVKWIVYRYEAARRLPAQEHGDDRNHSRPTLPLPPVPDSIEEGRHYVAAEIHFSLRSEPSDLLHWVAIVEPETRSVLLLRAYVDDVGGMVFATDPITLGNPAATPAAADATLNPLRSSALLPGLVAPVGGVQSLQGEFVQILDFESAAAAPPTQPTGTDFNYAARTNDFAAVSAYYHCDRFFRLVEELGFDRNTYFDGSTFPIPVYYRGSFGTANGIEINASCTGNGAGGILNNDYELADLSNLANPIGLACDWRVVLHELGGHGILYDHVNSANFGFAHSAGDSFAAILNDPDTQAADRFVTFPWVPLIPRRHDRSVAAGWAWGGTQDQKSYDSEQILCTTHFRIYRSIGGDSSSVTMRSFAARFMAYLMLRAVGTLTPATNPTNASGFVTALLTADAGDWTSEGLAGGAYGKVIRWAFEKQGLFQPPGAPAPVVSAGAPPDVDVFIDDGRHGEYQFQANHWSCQDIWNRRAADGGTTHENPIVGLPNYAYVRIKNRGTQSATNVVVRGFHCKPSSGLVWPNDWQAMATPQVAAPNIAASNAVGIVVGPFQWIPSQLDHECMLMIASATGDATNADLFSAGDSIPEWRLVPHDNNIGQRNVSPVPAGSGVRVLVDSFQRRRFWVNNPHRKTARVEIRPVVPRLLSDRDWRLVFHNPGGQAFSLEPGQSREIVMSLNPGVAFSREDLRNAVDPTIEIECWADDILIGGMSYPLDEAAPLVPGPPKKNGKHHCAESARDLLGRLEFERADIRSVRVRSVQIEIEFEDECD